jgi:hypothetical protein
MPQDRDLPVHVRLVRRRTHRRHTPLQLKIRRHGDLDRLRDLARVVRSRRPHRQRGRGQRKLQQLPRRHMQVQVRGHHLHGQLRVALGDVAIGKSARVVGLVLHPHPHVALRRLRHDELHLIHMSVGKIRRLARPSAPRREVEQEHAIGRHAVQVRRDALVQRVHICAVPSLEGLDRPILMRRRLEVLRRLRHRRHRNLLPRPRAGLLRGCSGNEECGSKQGERKKGAEGFHCGLRSDESQSRMSIPSGIGDGQ